MSEEQKQVTIQELIEHLQEQVGLAEVRAKLQSLNAEIAKGRAEELQALAFIAQITNPMPQEQQEEEEEFPVEKPASKRKLKTD